MFTQWVSRSLITRLIYSWEPRGVDTWSHALSFEHSNDKELWLEVLDSRHYAGFGGVTELTASTSLRKLFKFLWPPNGICARLLRARWMMVINLDQNRQLQQGQKYTPSPSEPRRLDAQFNSSVSNWAPPISLQSKMTCAQEYPPSPSEPRRLEASEAQNHCWIKGIQPVNNEHGYQDHTSMSWESCWTSFFKSLVTLRGLQQLNSSVSDWAPPISLQSKFTCAQEPANEATWYILMQVV